MLTIAVCVMDVVSPCSGSVRDALIGKGLYSSSATIHPSPPWGTPATSSNLRHRRRPSQNPQGKSVILSCYWRCAIAGSLVKVPVSTRAFRSTTLRLGSMYAHPFSLAVYSTPLDQTWFEYPFWFVRQAYILPSPELTAPRVE